MSKSEAVLDEEKRGGTANLCSHCKPSPDLQPSQSAHILLCFLFWYCQSKHTGHNQSTADPDQMCDIWCDSVHNICQCSRATTQPLLSAFILWSPRCKETSSLCCPTVQLSSEKNFRWRTHLNDFNQRKLRNEVMEPILTSRIHFM